MSTLDELEAEFSGGKSGKAAPAASSLDDLENEFSGRSKEVPKPANFASAEPKAALPDFKGSTLQIGPLDTRIPIGEGVGRGLAQIGSGMADIGLGGRQMMGLATRQEADDKKALDAQLNTGVAGKINNFAGKVLPFTALPSGMLPKSMGAAAPILEGAGYGALAGLFEPVGEGGSRVANTVLGGVGGGMAPLVINGIANAMRPVGKEVSDLVRKAWDMGIPLAPRDYSKNALTKATASVLDDMPITAGVGAEHREAVNKAIQNNVAETFGAKSLSAADVQAAKQALGKDFDRLWNNTKVDYDANLFGSLQQLEGRLDELTPEAAAVVRKRLADIPNKVVQDPSGRLYLPGTYVNSLQSELGSLASSGNGSKVPVIGEFRKALLDAFGRSTSPADAQALAATQRKWGAYKTVAPLVNKSAAGVAGREEGDVIALLPGAIAQRYPSVAESPFAEIAPIAGRFGTDRVARTGGGPRALVQNAITAGLAGAGGALGVSGGYLPQVAMGAGALGTAGYAAQKILNSPKIGQLAAGVKPGSAMGALGSGTFGLIGQAIPRVAAAGALGMASSLAPARTPPLEQE